MQSAEFYFALRIPNSMCGGSSMVEPQFSKLMTRVRSSFSAFPKDEGCFFTLILQKGARSSMDRASGFYPLG